MLKIFYSKKFIFSQTVSKNEKPDNIKRIWKLAKRPNDILNNRYIINFHCIIKIIIALHCFSQFSLYTKINVPFERNVILELFVHIFNCHQRCFRSNFSLWRPSWSLLPTKPRVKSGLSALESTTRVRAISPCGIATWLLTSNSHSGRWLAEPEM